MEDKTLDIIFLLEFVVSVVIYLIALYSDSNNINFFGLNLNIWLAASLLHIDRRRSNVKE